MSFGYSVPGAGDLNHDGFGDVLVGDPGPITTIGPCAAYVFHGGAASLTGADTLQGSSGTMFGNSLVDAADALGWWVRRPAEGS